MKKVKIYSLVLIAFSIFNNQETIAQSWIIPTNSSTVTSTSNNAIGTSNSGSNTNYFSIKTGGNEKMRLPVSGGVGVGQGGFPSGWSTGADLEVFNNGWPELALSAMFSSAKSNVLIGMATDNSGGWLNPSLTTGDAYIVPNGTSSQDLILSSSASNTGMIRFSTGSTLTERMTIKDNGNVLVNFGNNPVCNLPSGAMFGVNGTIYATGVKVELNNASGNSLCFPDYVFEKNYKLTPLTELESFIKQNRHLPGIPGAADVEKNGLDMVEMDTKLLEKIEELTLYVIQTNKQLEQLKKENEELKKLIPSVK